ncbi:MAG TPA: beta-galactosidase [Ferruginibacter sp.]|nr:beta-galactosidase [Ferruginibacter sp.]
MRKILLLTLLLCFVSGSIMAQKSKHSFALGKTEFLLDGKPFQIISGEMHPARIPQEYWRHRIQMAKAMGCNSIAVYIFWNYHETSEGVFDFKTENRDIAKFIRTCQEENMWVILRPGPYVCAEWDFGGLPSYLLKIPDIKIRCMDPRYMKAANRYIKKLAKQVVSLQCTKAGPILMVQVENEYGSYGNDKTYMETLRNTWIKHGINVPFYTSDGPTAYMLEAGNIDGAAIGLDSGSDSADFAKATQHNPNVPSFSGETYPGWLTHWGEKWQRPDTLGLKREVEYLLKNKKSFNFYVIHGGTNFGFTAGANASSPTSYQPDITSYDYDAPINDQGSATPKYYMLRQLIQQYVDYKLPDVPQPINSIQYPAIEMKKVYSLWDYNLPTFKSPQPKPMEMYGQNQGLILYKTKLIGHKSGKLKIWEPHDYALVFLNGKFIDTVYRDGGNWEVNLPKTDVPVPELEILVEGMGHINFAQFMIDRKGITDRVTLNGMTLMDWETTLFPMDEKFIASARPVPEQSNENKPCTFYEGSFEVSEIADTYFDLGSYFKGYVYINGHNLGRYWNIGPQKRLYCPASWLKTGTNKLLIFDLLETNAFPVKTKYFLTN